MVIALFMVSLVLNLFGNTLARFFLIEQAVMQPEPALRRNPDGWF